MVRNKGYLSWTALQPLILGAIVVGFLALLKIDKLQIERIEFVLGAVITCAATLSGFILSSVSILIGLSGSPIMRHMKKEGALPELRCRYTSALIYGIVLIVICISIGIVVGTAKEIVGFQLYLIVASTVAFLFSTVITGHYLLALISVLHAKDPTVKQVTEPETGYDIGGS